MKEHTDGHYHVTFGYIDDDDDDSDCGEAIHYNDSFEVIRDQIAKHTEPITSLGFVCAFGCGVLHELSDEKLIRLGVIKVPDGTFERLSDSYTKQTIPMLIEPKCRAAVTLIVRNNRILCSQRISKFTPMFWQFVGGTQEFDETPKQAARREVKEETGIWETKVDDFIPLCSGVGPGPVFVDFFVLKNKAAHTEPAWKEPTKNTAWTWLTPYEIVTRPHFPLMDLALKKYLELDK